MVKRVIAIGGDTVRFREGRVWLKKKGEADFTPIAREAKGKHQYCDYDPQGDQWGQEEADSFEERHGDATYITLGRSEPGPSSFRDALAHTLKRTSEKVTATEDSFGPIPEGHAFMVGDNREHSEDSRYWGTVPYPYMKGPALFDLFSWGGEVKKDECKVSSAWLFWNNLRWHRLFKGID